MLELKAFNDAKAAQDRLNKLFYPQRVVKVWNKGEVIRLSKKYITRQEFKDAHNGAYIFALKEDVSEAFTHFDNRYKWSKGNIIAVVAKCEFFQELNEKFPGAYAAAKDMGMLKDIKKKLPYRATALRLAWPDERIRKVSMKFKYLKHLANAYPQAYHLAKVDGELLEELREFYATKRREAKRVAIKEKSIQTTINRAEGYKKRTKWTEETLWAEVQKYESCKEFRANSKTAYSTLSNQGKIKEYTAHFSDSRNRLSTEEKMFENVKAEADRCGSLELFRKRNPNMCKLMYLRGWRGLLFPDVVTVGPTKWHKENILLEMRKYDKPSKFQNANGAAYMKGRRLGLQPEYTKYFDSL